MGLSQWPDKFREHDSDDFEDTKRLVWAKIDLQIYHITEKAWGLGEQGHLLWIPISQIKQATIKEGDSTGDFDADDVEVDDHLTHVQIPLWLAEAEDLDWED